MSNIINKETAGGCLTNFGLVLLGVLFVSLPIVDASIKPQNYVAPRVQTTDQGDKKDGCVDVITDNGPAGEGTIGALDKRDKDYPEVIKAFRSEDPSLELQIIRENKGGVKSRYCLTYQRF